MRHSAATDLGGAHHRFHEWLVGGAIGTPPRDVLVHAAYCGDCTDEIAAIDALADIDAARAAAPAAQAIAAASPRRRWWLGTRATAMGRMTALTAAGLVLAVSAGIVASGFLLARGGIPPFVPPGEQDVLGGAGPGTSQSPTATDGSTFGAIPTPASTGPSTPGTAGSPDATAVDGPLPTGPGGVTPAPGFTPPPTAPLPTATFRPVTPAPTPTPTPAPTAAPTPPPTPTATPTPTPSPTDGSAEPTASAAVTSECADGMDNDGDFLVDLLDPGCLLGLGNDESLD